MENQHRKISGYRELNQQEIDLMNEIKALGPQIEAVIVKVQKHISDQEDHAMGRVLDPELNRKVSLGIPDDAESVALRDRLVDATPARFAAASKTDFQTALMLLTRAVAQPTFF
jgi:hypothetical protein